MDANMLVLSALRTGAIANTRYSRITTDRAKESYEGLKSLLYYKFSGRGQKQAAQLIKDWDENYASLAVEEQMKQELGKVEVGFDPGVMDTADRLLKQLWPQRVLHSGIVEDQGGDSQLIVTS